MALIFSDIPNLYFYEINANLILYFTCWVLYFNILCSTESDTSSRKLLQGQDYKGYFGSLVKSCPDKIFSVGETTSTLRMLFICYLYKNLDKNVKHLPPEFG